MPYTTTYLPNSLTQVQDSHQQKLIHDRSDKAKELITTLQEHCKTVTAPFKYPRKIEFVNSLPKTVSGKIRRSELREREKKYANL